MELKSGPDIIERADAFVRTKGHDPYTRIGEADELIEALTAEIERLRRIMANRLGGMVVEPHALVCPICGWDEKSKMQYLKHVVEKHSHWLAGSDAS